MKYSAGRKLCVVSAFLLILGGCTRQKPSPGVATEPAFSKEHPRKIVFQSDWFPQAEHGGFYQALMKGYYADVGLDVTIAPGGTGVTNVRLAVARGDAQFAMFRSDNLELSIAKEKLPLLMIGAVTQHDAEALLVHEDSPVRTFADLNGRTLIASPGQVWLGFLERKYGVAFNLIPNKGNLAIFLGDPNAIQQCVFTSEPYLARLAGAKVRVLPLTDAGYDVYTAIFSRADFLRDNPVATRAFLAATLRGWRDFLEGDPAPAFDEILRRNPQMTAGLLKFSRDEMIAHRIITGDPAKGEGIGRLSADRVVREMETLVSQKILDAAVPVSQVMNIDYLPAGE